MTSRARFHGIPGGLQAPVPRARRHMLHHSVWIQYVINQ